MKTEMEIEARKRAVSDGEERSQFIAVGMLWVSGEWLRKSAQGVEKHSNDTINSLTPLRLGQQINTLHNFI